MRVISNALAGHRDRIMQRKGDEGFTLIELLIVVLIIGVLAAIAIPIYLNATQGAADNTAKSNVQSAVTAIGVYITEHNGTLPTAASWAADVNFPNAPSGEAGYVTYSTDGAGEHFCVEATGAGTNTFRASDVSGVDAGTCTAGVAS